MAGPIDSGKSLVQNLITVMFGDAPPTLQLHARRQRISMVNLWREHLMIEDEIGPGHSHAP